MKIRKINILFALSFGALMAFVGCKKDDGPIPSRITVDAVPAVSTSVDASGSTSIDMTNLAGFSGKFKVALYFDNAVPPKKVDIVVRKNASVANVKLYKADVTSLPAAFTVTAAEIATLFGTAIAANDTYDFAPDLYVGDKKYEAFPAVGTGTGAGVVAMPGFSAWARYTAK